MTPETFAEWLRRLGHRVVRTRSSYWFDQGPRVFQAFPYHWVIQPSEEELQDFLRAENAIGLRYSTPLASAEGACSYHIVYERPTYGIGDVDRSVRAKVRRGLEACQVGPIPLERYAREGWAIEQDTLHRQHRHARYGRAHWERMVTAAADLEGFEVWAAEVEGRLAATLMLVRSDDTINLLYQQSRQADLPLRVNNALLFEATRALAARPGIRLIHNGLHSLDAPASVDQFKLRLGYIARPLRQRVVFHPALAPWIGPGSGRLLGRLAELFPANAFIRKAEGLTRFYCNGKLPLDQQAAPELLGSGWESLSRLAPAPPPEPPPPAEPPSSAIRIVPAALADLERLIALHLSCIPDQQRVDPDLVRPFLRVAYRWFLTSPGALVLGAWTGGQLVGLTALSDRPCHLPVSKVRRRQIAIGLLRPWMSLRIDRPKRVSPLQLTHRRRATDKMAQIAFMGVEPGHRGVGIGWALKSAAIEACRGWGATILLAGLGDGSPRTKSLSKRADCIEVPGPRVRHLTCLRLDQGSLPPLTQPPFSRRTSP
jgi:GNAT superfamily N-acetyltransferase